MSNNFHRRNPTIIFVLLVPFLTILFLRSDSSDEYDSKLQYHFQPGWFNAIFEKDRYHSNVLPDYFQENHQWDVGILKAPTCPTVNVIRLIKSARYNSEKRRLIRSHMRNQGASNVGVFFVVGLGDSFDQRGNDWEKEMNQFNDFIIGDFIDSYRNITLKTFSAYKYVSEYCSNNENRVILIHDDDILINEINFNSYLVNNLGKQDNNNHHMTCLLQAGKIEVLRSDKFFASQYNIDHYSVKKEDYALDYYPSFCLGACTLLSDSTVQQIYETAKVTNPRNFALDDVLFTGIMRVKSNLPIPYATESDICGTPVGKGDTKMDNFRNTLNRYCNNHGITSCLIENE